MHHVAGIPRLIGIALVLLIFAMGVGWVERMDPSTTERWQMRGLFVAFALVLILLIAGYRRLW